MPDLSIQVAAAKVVPFSASPTIAFQLHISNALAAEEIHTIALRCQIQIEVTRRGYAPPNRLACSISSAIPIAGARRYATCCGCTRASWCRHSMVQARLSI